MVLGILLFAVYFQNDIPEHAYKYLLFFQNASPEFARFFPVSWSLCIEQWSYIWKPSLLLFSPLMFTILHCQSRKETTWLVILILCIILTVLARAAVYLERPTNWDNDFRKQIPMRLDAIMFGVLIARVKLFSPNMFSCLSHPICFMICVVLLYCLSTQYTMQMFAPYENFFVKVPAFSLVNLLCALMLCFLDSSPKIHFLFDPKKTGWPTDVVGQSVCLFFLSCALQLIYICT